MFKTKILKIISLTLFLILSLSGGIFWRNYGFKINNTYPINTDPSYIRIYYDFASVPTLHQVYDFVNQSSTAVSFVLWDRIPNLEQNLANKPNVYLLHHNGKDDFSINPQKILEYYKANPNIKFIVHSNAMWVKNIFSILNSIPRNAVKEIHLYEDGSYSMTYKNNKKQEIEYDLYRQVILSKYKVIYHMEDGEYLNSLKCLTQQRCRNMKLKYKNDIVVKSSINIIKNGLDTNPEMKNNYFKIFNFNYKKYKKEMKHPFGIFTFTIYRNDNFARKQLDFMNALLYQSGNLNYLVKNKNTTWYYKEHPEKKTLKRIKNIIEKENPELIPIEKHQPLELFLLADIIPDYVAGYSSSIYLNLPKKCILAYIKRPIDPYLYIINRENMIRAGRIFEITDFTETKRAKYHRLKSKLLTIFQ